MSDCTQGATNDPRQQQKDKAGERCEEQKAGQLWTPSEVKQIFLFNNIYGEQWYGNVRVF